MSKMQVVREAVASCGVASCLWRHDERPSRIRIVVRSEVDWFELEVPIKLSYSDSRIVEILSAAIRAAQAEQKPRGAQFDGAGLERDVETLDMFELSA